MNETLEKRKLDLVRYLNDEYAEKPQKWWHRKEAKYIHTGDVGIKKKFQFNPQEIIIKYDLKRALSGSALFFIFYLVCILWPTFDNSNARDGLWLNTVVFMIIVVLPSAKFFTRKPLLILSKDGLYINKIKRIITWELLAASYIKADENDEFTNYYLVIHYYEETKDEFVKVECSLEGLDMQREEIAFYIECWKIKTANKSCIV